MKFDKFSENDIILKVVAMILLPFLFVLGAYVVINGHISPGGGFSGGTILGAALVLHAQAFGREDTRKVFTAKTFTNLTVFSLLAYGLMKGYSFTMGAAGLDTGIPTGTPGAILSGGLILPLNIGVGIIVASTIYALYSLFNEGEI